MKGNISVAWLLAAAVGLSSCGSDGSQYQPPPAAAPDGLSYPDPNLFTQGTTITPLVPMVRGTPTSYWVSPDLPAGLRLNADGTISGTPSEPKSPATYLVSAGNSSGVSSFGVRITVVGRFKVGGSVAGLTGAGLVLTNNGVDNLAITAAGPFQFATGLPAGSAFLVAVATQPSGQICGVSSGSGSITNDNFLGVTVNCSANTPKLAQGVVDPPVALSCLLAENLVLVEEVESAASPVNASTSFCGSYSITTDPVTQRVLVANVATGTVSVYSAH